MDLDVTVCLPQEADTVWLVRNVVRHALNAFGVHEACIEDIALALSEACSNVIEHASSSDQYEVHLHVDEDVCELRVVNTGDDGLDAGQLAGVMPGASSASGRGVAIMRAVMDIVDFRSEPEIGTIVHLVKGLTLREDGLMARLRNRT